MGQVTVSKDGQQVVLPWEEASGRELKEHLNIAPERIPTIVENGRTRAVGDHERVRLQDGVYVSDAPRFRYGAAEEVEVVISEADLQALQEHLHHNPLLEQHAFLFAGICRSEGGVRLLVRDAVFARPEDFLSQTAAYLDLSPSYFLPALDRCRAEGLHLIEAHSHPFVRQGVRFSSLDVQNELEKFPYYVEKLPDMCAATLVFGHDSVDGHWWDARNAAIRPVSRLRVVGSRLRVLPTTGGAPNRCIPDPDREIFRRQELALGGPGQALIRQTRVGIIGCGGLGSILAQQLAYLGVRDFVLVDDDVVEETNLNRLVGATPEDARVAAAKVAVVARAVRNVRPDAAVTAIRASIADVGAQQQVKDVDILFCGADSDGARLVANMLAVRYLIPYYDLGTGINVLEDRVAEAGGQLWLVRPGGFCLQCTGAIDPYRARVDLMDEGERRRHIARGYGVDSAQPSVIFLNAALASLAVGEMVSLLTGYKPSESMVFYDAVKSSVQPFTPPAVNADCPVCHRSALYGRGDEPESTGLHRAVPFAALTPQPEPIAVA